MGVTPDWPLRNNRPPSWRYQEAQQIARSLAEFNGKSTSPSVDPVNHRTMAMLIEERSPNVRVFVNRQPGNPFGSNPELIRNKGAQFRMQGLIEDYSLKPIIQSTNFCRDLGNGLINEKDYWKKSLLELSLGYPRVPQWNPNHLQGVEGKFQFPIVKQIIRLVHVSEQGIKPSDFITAYHGHECDPTDIAFDRLKANPNNIPSQNMIRSIRELMRLMGEFKIRGSDSKFGAGWLEEDSKGIFTLTDYGSDVAKSL